MSDFLRIFSLAIGSRLWLDENGAFAAGLRRL
jgi:hypothetical protein